MSDTSLVQKWRRKNKSDLYRRVYSANKMSYFCSFFSSLSLWADNCKIAKDPKHRHIYTLDIAEMLVGLWRPTCHVHSSGDRTQWEKTHRQKWSATLAPVTGRDLPEVGGLNRQQKWHLQSPFAYLRFVLLLTVNLFSECPKYRILLGMAIN